jgi:PIN domain nuclease of toxin-antitoxin system
MVFIDTHIAVWLYNGFLERLTKKARITLDANDIYISPICALEIEYLKEVGKIKKHSADILGYLIESIDLRVDDIPLAELIEIAIREKWTRDPFDRMIVAHARARNALLVTADMMIRNHYRKSLI